MKTKLADIMFSVGLGLIWVSVTARGLHIFWVGQPVFFPAAREIAVVGVGFVVVSLLCAFFLAGTMARMHLPAFGLGAGIVFFSNFYFRPFNFFQVPSVAMELLIAAVGGAVLCFAGRFRSTAIVFICLASLAAGAFGFISASQGRLIFSDDHPSFLYRLLQLKDNFPFIPFYNPLWNGGVEAREFFPSGALSVFFVGLPFVYLTDLSVTYNLIVVLILFVVTPGCMYLAGRFGGFSRSVSCIAGLLAACSSVYWFRYALSYGTLGFVVFAACLPLVMVLCGRFGEGPLRRAPLAAVLLFIAVSLCLFWPLSVIALVPMGAIILLKLRSFLGNRWFVAVLVAVFVVHVPWMLLFTHASKVTEFVAVAGSGGSEVEAAQPAGENNKRMLPGGDLIASYIRFVREQAPGIHPAILLVGPVGVVFLSGLLRWLWAGALLWLALLGTLGARNFPHLELERMLIVAALLMAFSTAAVCQKLLEARPRLERWFGALVLGLFLLTPWHLYRLASNQTTQRFYFAEPIVASLSQAITQHSGEGRLLFAGFILHDLSHGHVAPLAAFTGKPLIASRYQHDRWEYEDVIPASFRSRGEAGVEDYLNLYNVSAVITHERFWRSWFSSRPSKYELVWREGKFSLFRRIGFQGSFVYSGQARVLGQSGSEIRVKVESDPVVLRFNYAPFLTASACKISGVEVAQDIQFISLSECGSADEVVIRSIGPMQRLVNTLMPGRSTGGL